MLPASAGRESSSGGSAPPYVRHRPERTVLYQIVDEYYPAFKGFCPSCGARRMAESAALLVDEAFPEQPVRQWVLSVPYPLRFLFASRPEVMGRVLGIVYRCITTHLIRKAGFSRNTAQTGAVTLIQRFGSALNLNVHFHMLFLDGAFIEHPDGSVRFRWVKAPTSAELVRLTQALALRIGRCLERQGLLERDTENSYLAGHALEAGPMGQLLGSSITYRISTGCLRGATFRPTANTARG